MKYKSIFKLCLLTTFLSVATISCDDWTEMEIHDSQVNGFKEQNPKNMRHIRRIFVHIRQRNTLSFMPGWIMLRKYLPVRRTFSVRCRTVSI